MDSLTDEEIIALWFPNGEESDGVITKADFTKKYFDLPEEFRQNDIHLTIDEEKGTGSIWDLCCINHCDEKNAISVNVFEECVVSDYRFYAKLKYNMTN